MHITPLGDTALVVELGERVDEPTHHRVQAALRLLEATPLAGVTEVVPAFTTLTLFYDPLLLAAPGQPPEHIIAHLTKSVQARLRKLPDKVKPVPRPIVEIPVCYGGPFGPDLEEIAEHAGLTPEEVVRRHSSTQYLVYVIGFSPGFPYLGGLPECRLCRDGRPPGPPFRPARWGSQIISPAFIPWLHPVGGTSLAVPPANSSAWTQIRPASCALATG